MAIRDERVVDGENVIPSREPDDAVRRLEREITNGTISDLVDLDVALRSWEYRYVPQDTQDRLRVQLGAQEAD